MLGFKHLKIAALIGLGSMNLISPMVGYCHAPDMMPEHHRKEIEEKHRRHENEKAKKKELEHERKKEQGKKSKPPSKQERKRAREWDKEHMAKNKIK